MKLTQARQDEMQRLCALQIHSDLSAWHERALAKCAFGFLHILQDLLAAQIVGLAIHRGADVARRTLQQPDT
ncbi:hypothetical protein D3C72_2075520 [compost metagenome]